VLEKNIYKLWYGKRGFIWCLLWPFSLLYGWVAWLKKSCYRLGIFKTYRAPCKVFIVGNQTVGGGGKTPMVIALVDFFQKQGKQVGVICKGYKGSLTKEPQLVHLEKHNATQVGDEAILLTQKLSCPVVAAQNRVAGAKYLLAQYPGCEIIISDDGLGHLALGRDLEIILENKALGLGNGSLLPAGPLRERLSKNKNGRIFVESVTLENPPLQNAAHFDSPSRGELGVISIGEGESTSSDLPPDHHSHLVGESTSSDLPPEHNSHLVGESKSLILERGDNKNFIIYRYPGKIYNLATKQEVTTEELNSKASLTAVCAIAHPQQFFNTLQKLGLNFKEQSYPDHYTYSALNFNFKSTYVITEKDASKCASLVDCNLYVLPLEAQLNAFLCNYLQINI